MTVMQDFFGVFATIRRDYPSTPVVSYYDATFQDALRDHVGAQKWDMPPIERWFVRINPSTTVDLCSGEGRIAQRLHHLDKEAEIIGMDSSSAAEEAFRGVFTGARNVGFSRLDVLLDTPPQAIADYVVVGSLTVNSFVSASDLSRFLLFSNRLLRPGGYLVLFCFNEGIRDRFSDLSGAMDTLPVIDAGGDRSMVWRGVHFDPESGIFLQNYFLGCRDPFPGVLGFLRERIWEAPEVLNLAAKVDLDLVDSSVVTIDEGGAEGWEASALLLGRSR